jgi:hypothetical protein
MSILITRPRYEKITHYLYYWSEVIVDEAKKRTGVVIDLKKKKASRKLVESYLAKQNPEIVIFNGHGDEVCVTGHDDEVLIEAGKNSSLLRNKVVYMRSCDSGKILGPQIVKEGAKAFIGYTELFRFWTDNNSVKDPLNDEYAIPFFETSNQVALSLVKGKVAKEAHEDSLKVYEKMISKLLTSDAPNSFVVSDLIWNMHNQICLER